MHQIFIVCKKKTMNIIIIIVTQCYITTPAKQQEISQSHDCELQEQKMNAIIFLFLKWFICKCKTNK